jgi:class 3 adenylate cyclase/tetratricopeptide (TPR) repeat protein
MINPAPDTQSDSNLLNPQALERRHLTVLFSDLVGSTALSEELDPEDLSGVIDWYHSICREVIERFGGYVARYVGDGILAYFGWPQASENDAERTVRAGLELVDLISSRLTPDGRRVAVRVAVASGLVVVRTLGGRGDVVGETPNLAARLQSLAEPNSVVVAPTTWRLAGDMFEYRDLGEHSLKGITNRIRVRQVLQTRPAASRFEGYREQWLVPFVARTKELSLLIESWNRVQKAEGRAVFVSGESGVGKSRLIREFYQRIRHQAVAVMRYQCSPIHTTTPLYPVIQQIRAAAGLSDRESADERVEKLTRFLLGTGVEIEPALPFICNLLQIKSANVARLPDIAPPQLRQQLIETLWAQVRCASERGPVLAIIEDVQWIDPTTEEFVCHALSQLSRHPICVVATSRKQFPETWDRGAHISYVSLGRLTRRASASLVAAASGGRFDRSMVERIVARADGVPLFLEEVTRAICDGRANKDFSSRHWSEGDVPASLQALLTERLDRTARGKYLAQIGAVFGRQFETGAVQVLAQWPPGEVEKGLDDLLVSGLVKRCGAAANKQFVFKHSLVQEAAYEGLLNTEKKRLHRGALSYLEGLTKFAISDAAEMLSFHAERGQVWEKAAQYLSVACGRAIAKSANREAIALFDRGLAALDHLPGDQAGPYAVDLRLHVYPALLAMGDIDRLIAIMREADQLAHDLGDKRRQAATLCQLASGLWLAGQHRTGLEYAETAETLASEIQDFSIGLAARFNRANLHHALGMVGEAAQMYASILDALEGDLRYKRLGWTALPSVLTCGFLAWCAVDMGDFVLARNTVDEALRIVEKVPEPYSIVYAHMANGLYKLGRGEPREAITAFEAAKVVNERSQMKLPIATAWLARAYVQGGRPEDALSILTEADRTITYKHGGKYNWFHHHLSMAQAYLAVRNLPSAQAAATRAQEIAVTAEEIVHVAWACKVRGDIAIKNEDGEVARLAYTQALEISRPRGLLPLEAHCHAGLARLERQLGRPSEAARHQRKAEEIYGVLKLAAWPATDHADAV